MVDPISFRAFSEELTKLARFYDDDRMWDRVFNRRVAKNSLKGLLAGAALGATVVGPLSAAVLKKQYGDEERKRLYEQEWGPVQRLKSDHPIATATGWLGAAGATVPASTKIFGGGPGSLILPEMVLLAPSIIDATVQRKKKQREAEQREGAQAE